MLSIARMLLFGAGSGRWALSFVYVLVAQAHFQRGCRLCKSAGKALSRWTLQPGGSLHHSQKLTGGVGGLLPSSLCFCPVVKQPSAIGAMPMFPLFQEGLWCAVLLHHQGIRSTPWVKSLGIPQLPWNPLVHCWVSKVRVSCGVCLQGI